MTTSIALYQLTADYLALAEKLADGDFDATTINDTIEASGLLDSIQDKAQGIEFVAREAEKYCPLIDMEIERLQALKAQRARVAAGLRAYLLRNMEAAGIEKIECAFFKLSIRKNPPAVDVWDDKQIPAAFWVTPEPKPVVQQIDKKAISAAIKAGVEVPGAKLVQHTRLVVQ